jgi:hypothetical protein
MAAISLSDWNAIAQLFIAVFTVVGVIASLYFSTKALREIQADRKQKQKPHLAFEYGGYRYPIRFVKAGKKIPGVNPKYVKQVFSNMSENVESVRLDEKKEEDGSIKSIRIGRLKNYGLGPAISTCVTWIPQKVWIGSESFEIDYKKLVEPIYSSSLNNMPSIPSHISPNEEGGLSRLPTFIEKDVEKKLTKVDGLLQIKTKDVFGTTIITEQEFYLFTGYKEESPWVHVTFSDIIS